MMGSLVVHLPVAYSWSIWRGGVSECVIFAGAEFRAYMGRVLELAGTESIQPVWLAYADKALVRSGLVAETRHLLADAESRVNEDNPNDRAAVALLKGEIAAASGEHIEAIEQFEMALALRYDNFYLEALAHGHFVNGDFDAAAVRYKEISDRKDLGWEGQDPWILSHYYLGRIGEEKGDPEGAAAITRSSSTYCTTAATTSWR